MLVESLVYISHSWSEEQYLAVLVQSQTILDGIEETAVLLLLKIGANIPGLPVVHRKNLDQHTDKRCPCELSALQISETNLCAREAEQ